MGSPLENLSNLRRTGSGFVLMMKNGLRFDLEHLFTIKPAPVGRFRLFKPAPKYGILKVEIKKRLR